MTDPKELAKNVKSAVLHDLCYTPDLPTFDGEDSLALAYQASLMTTLQLKKRLVELAAYKEAMRARESEAKAEV